MIQRRAAFSLLELSVVIAIIALVAAIGTNVGQNALRASARLSTQERLAVIKTALDAYADRNGYLPCPADPAMLPSNANFGIESRNATAGLGCTASGAVAQASSVWFGTVPVRNLGLDDSYIADAWGGKLLYAVSNSHTGATASGLNSYGANAGTITVRTGSRTGTNYMLTTDNTGVPNAGATYIVISFGRNQRGAYPMNSVSVATACGADATLTEVENCDRSNATFYDSTYNESLTQPAVQFDDIVVWGTNLTKRNPIAVLTNSCLSGCDPWCAPCEAARTSTAPGTPTRLCAKFITKNTPNCEAVCIWPGSTTPCP